MWGRAEFIAGLIALLAVVGLVVPLSGETLRAATIPVRRFHFEQVVNLETAKALGLTTVPQSLLLRADQVIQ